MKKILVLTFTLLFTASVFAQITTNPNDEFYDTCRQWQVKGIIGFLPQLSPYPRNVVENILSQVIENGNESDVELAEYYREKYFGRSWNLYAEGTYKNRITDYKDTGTKHMGAFNTGVLGDIQFHPLVSFGYQGGVMVQNKSTETREVLPLYQNVLDETYDDPVTVSKLVANLELCANLSFGNETVYGMAGINRLGYGNFFGDSMVLSPESYHSGNFVFAVEKEKWSYAQTVQAISASPNNGTKGYRPEKYLAFHSIRFTPSRYFAFSYFESSVFGQRFDPCYFIPAPYNLVQGMFSECDNTMSGIQFEIRPVDRFEIAVSGAIDDINTNGFLEGKFDSRLKLALNAGLAYTPESDFCKLVSADYTLITPYTYSHAPASEKADEVRKDTINYDNYKNRNTCIGSELPPDSDRFKLQVKFTPVKRLNVGITTSLIRHANALESISDSDALTLINYANRGGYATDGSIDTAPIPEEIQEKNTFMKQEHKMYIVQAGFDVDWEIFRKQNVGAVSFGFAYMFEYVHNKGVDRPIYYGTDTDPKAARKAWVDSLHDEYNNYFTISLKYTY